MYKLQFLSEILYSCFCTFQPVKIPGKFCRGVIAQRREPPSGNAASHCLPNNQSFCIFSNTLSCRDSVYMSQVNIWWLKTHKALPLTLSPAISHLWSTCREPGAGKVLLEGKLQ